MYGLRLIDATRDRTPTELLDLIQWLGPGSALSAAKTNPKNPSALAGWGHVEDMLLSLINLTEHQTYVLRQVNNPKKEKVPEPIPGPRGKKPAKKRNDAHEMARALLQAKKKGV